MDLNLHTLSEGSGVAYSTVYNLFTGKKSITDAKTESLYRIAKALDMTMDELYEQFIIREHDGGRIMPDFTLMWEDEEVGFVRIGDKTVRIERFDTNLPNRFFSLMRSPASSLEGLSGHDVGMNIVPIITDF